MKMPWTKGKLSILVWCCWALLDQASSFLITLFPSKEYRKYRWNKILSDTVFHRILFSGISTKRVESKTRIESTPLSFDSGNATKPSKNYGQSDECLEIPIIGPLLDLKKPLVIGDSLWLDPPTPLQWKTLEASVAAQHGGIISDLESGGLPIMEKMATSELNFATTDASPLVALLHNGGKEYATIAAIEGIVSEKDMLVDKSETRYVGESAEILNSPYYRDSSKVRLLAVGRARLSHSMTKFLRSDLIEKGETNVAPEPLLVARMEMLLDSSELGKKALSPVHSLNRLSSLAQRLRFLQSDRQRIVQGLQAAQSKLEMAMEEWRDWDNIGSLNVETEGKPTTIDSQNTKVLNDVLHNYDCDENNRFSVSEYSLPLSAGAARCTKLDNFGLGTTTSAYVSLNAMVDVLRERVEKYYSPVRVFSEEFQYELLSWCVLQSLKTVLTSEEIHEALYECLSTCDRLEILYVAMMNHKMELTELADFKALELKNCGEECDFF